MFIKKLLLYLIVPAISVLLFNSQADCTQLYTYTVKPGDTLSEITLIFTGNLDYLKIARSNSIENPDLIFPGDKITLPCEKPLNTLRKYLRAIYVNEAHIAYKMLSSATRKKISLSEFKRSLVRTTFYDLKSLNVCADFIARYQHILQIKAFLKEDPASWGFNLVQEKYKWHILLFDLNPTFPLDDEKIDWKCK